MIEYNYTNKSEDNKNIILYVDVGEEEGDYKLDYSSSDDDEDE